MNSNSKNYVPRDSYIHKEDCGCDCHHPIGSKVIFESSCVNFGPLDVTFAEGALSQTFNRPIGSVSIDTTCLDCPKTLIRFTGILNVTTTTAATSNLNFSLFRLCNGMRVRQPLNTFNFYVAEGTGGVTFSNTLAFEFPVDNNCIDCCTYILELASISNFDFGTLTYSINGTLSAFATGQMPDC